MTENQHTPTPWQLVSVGATADNYHSAQLVSAGRGSMLLKHDGSPEGEANAALIVRAVNNHQALVEACKDGLRAMRALGWDQLVVGDIGAANRIAWTNAMMALKAATEDKL